MEPLAQGEPRADPEDVQTGEGRDPHASGGRQLGDFALLDPHVAMADATAVPTSVAIEAEGGGHGQALPAQPKSPIPSMSAINSAAFA